MIRPVKMPPAPTAQPAASPVKLGPPSVKPAKVPTKAKVQQPAAQVGDQMGAVPAEEDPTQV
jgi:hypothetical protein